MGHVYAMERQWCGAQATMDLGARSTGAGKTQEASLKFAVYPTNNFPDILGRNRASVV